MEFASLHKNLILHSNYFRAINSGEKLRNLKYSLTSHNKNNKSIIKSRIWNSMNI